MKKRYEAFLSAIDTERMLRQTETLWRAEFGQTFSCYHRSANLALQLLRENGFPNAEKITFPADGKTSWQDKIAPLGWDATYGKLTILSGPGFSHEFVAADYQKHPFHLIKGSCGTKPGGEILRLITFEQMLGGADTTDAAVLIQDGSGPGCPDLKLMLDLGARVIISDYAMNTNDEPDGLQWNNAFTEGSNWHVNAYDRPFLAFTVTPRIGRQMRKAACMGEVKIRVESDARRHEDTVDVVTALLPGRRQEEFWILAHLYEPLSNDNSAGVAAAMEILRQLQCQGTPEFSVRVIFGLEMYGFASYVKLLGDQNLSAKVIGGIDVDAMYLRDDWILRLRCASPNVPFYGNFLMRMLRDDLNGMPEVPKMDFQNSFPCMYDDDSFLGDPTIGVPILWPIRFGQKALWHNSGQTMEFIHPRAYAVGTAFNLTLVDSIVNPRPEYLSRLGEVAAAELAEERERAVGSFREHMERRCEILRQDMESFARALPNTDLSAARQAVETACATALANADGILPSSPWRDFAKHITPHRTHTGFPFDCAKAPVDARVKLPGSTIYSPLAAILANMDGKRDLAEAIRRTEHEICQEIPEKAIRKFIHILFYLADHGYLVLDGVPEIEQADIVRALREAGVQNGDFLLVHASLSAFGRIHGGAATVVEALKEAVGSEGTFLCPVLNFPFTYIGGPCGNRLYRPFDTKNLKSVWTGALPRYLLAQGYTCSNHYTHRWTGWGTEAEAACRNHQPTDGPVSENSPLGYALRRGGKIVHLGNDISSTTFLHYIEDRLSLPGVEDVMVKVRHANGCCTAHAVPRNLPGCREFYHGNEDTCKFFKAAVAAGLTIRKTTLGLGTVQLMEIPELYRIGMELAKRDPFIFLHDEAAGCLSCNRLRRNYLAAITSSNA